MSFEIAGSTDIGPDERRLRSAFNPPGSKRRTVPPINQVVASISVSTRATLRRASRYIVRKSMMYLLALVLIVG
jgi:hypothetical protein